MMTALFPRLVSKGYFANYCNYYNIKLSFMARGFWRLFESMELFWSLCLRGVTRVREKHANGSKNSWGKNKKSSC